MFYVQPSERIAMKRLALFLLPFLLHAGTVGKIRGKVIDAETGEPLAGVDVYIAVLGVGSAADTEGDYFILNVPPGEYDVEASMIGYRTEIKTRVQIVADRTTYTNFELAQTVIEIDKPIVVTAKKPVIEIDMTSKEVRVTRDDLDALPVEKPEEAIAMQGGVTTGSGGEIHVRGGRSGELAYYIDGIEVRNALFGTAPLVSKNLVSEMSLLSGTFNAEYGNVMSGVINIVTPEGGTRFSTHLEYISYMLNDAPYRKQDWLQDLDKSWYDARRDSLGNSLYDIPTLHEQRDVPFLGTVTGWLEGPLLSDRTLRLYVGGDYTNEESYLPFGYELSRSLHGKLTKRFGPGFKVLFDAQYFSTETQAYNHLYKYLYDHYLTNKSQETRIIGGVNHAPTNNFFYNIRFGYVAEDAETEPPGISRDTIIELVTDNYSEFYIDGYSVYWRDAKTEKYIVKADFNLQVGKEHSFTFGIEHNFHNLSLESRQQLFPRGPIDYQAYERNPMDGAVFIQDKIEHRYLVVNAGVRFDYSLPRTTMWEDIEDPTSLLSDVEPQYQLSPRLGLSHPITQNAMLHFAYGHFFQMPPYNIMYYNSDFIAHPESIPRYGLIGNARVRPQRTTAYEVGVKYALTDEYGVDVTLFYKDIRDLLATTEVRLYPYDYIIYTNEDFANVQGVDLTIKKEFVRWFGFTVNYTYQIARGNRSFAMQGFYDVYTGLPERMREYYLDFDRRHTISGTFAFSFTPLGGAGVNFKASSGLPYTPYISEGVVIEENSGRMDWSYSLDLMLHQGFAVASSVVDVFVKATNITDHLNPLYVYARSGEPWDSGEEAGGLMGSPDYIIDPSNVGPRRSIKLGVRITY